MRRVEMPTGLSGHIRSNVIGYVALFCFAMAGTAGALPGKNTVDSGDIINGQVRAADLRPGAVTPAGLAGNAVDSSKVADGSLVGADIADDSLLGVDVADGSLTGADVNEATLDPAVLQRRVTGSCGPGQTMQSIALDGGVSCGAAVVGGPPVGPAGGELTGSYPNPQIASGVINSAKVVDNSLTGADISDGNSLGGPEINEASLDGVAEVAQTTANLPSCDPPPNGQSLTCAAVDTDIVKRNRAIVVARTNAVNVSLASDTGRCDLMQGSTLLDNVVASPGGSTALPLVLLGITSSGASASSQITLRCHESENNRDMTFQRPRIVLLGS